MLTRILLGLSASIHGRAAADLALAWARREEAAVLAIGVVDEAVVAPPESVPLGATHYKQERDATLLEAARDETRALLAAFEARARAAGVAVVTHERSGATAEVLSEEAQRADVIVTGQQAGESEAALMQALGRLLPHASRPVLAVPPGAPQGGDVLVAYDGSLQAARALLAWTSLGALANARVHVLGIEQEPGELSAAVARAEEYLAGHRAAVTTIVERTEGSVADALLGAVGRLRPAVLVMGAYGRSRLADFFLGSVTRRLLAEMPVPLFLFH